MLDQIVRLDDEGYPIPIADLVRCGDCMYGMLMDEGTISCCGMLIHEKDWYCADGAAKRMDGAE